MNKEMKSGLTTGTCAAVAAKAALLALQGQEPDLVEVRNPQGQTLAMKTWHIRVVGRNGLPLPQWRALLRYFLSWIWFLPPLLVMAPFGLSGGEISVLMIGWVIVWALLSRFQAHGQFWHDVWAGTRLVEAPRLPPKDKAKPKG